jgi:hypothetical protein
MAIFMFIPNVGGILVLIVQLAYYSLILNLVLIIAFMRVVKAAPTTTHLNMRWIK